MARVGLITQLLLAAASANAYFLFQMNNVLATERLDPIVNPGGISGHVHSFFGGSNLAPRLSTSSLRQSKCTSSPIKEDNSNYWAPTLYFQWKNGSFTSVSGSPVIYYLYSDMANFTTPFPDDFRMISGSPTLRSYNGSDPAQRAVTFLCLNFSGVSTTSNEFPHQACPSGVRAQINFPSCWDGKNTDSADHKSHVAFLSDGPDKGTCKDPNYPKTLPRIFMEMYLDTPSFDGIRDKAMNPSQPFVYAMGDPTGYGYHADFFNGWRQDVLQKVLDGCNCNSFGDPTCCVQKNIFTFAPGGSCKISPAVDEQTLGTLLTLPGNNPVVPEGGNAQNLPATTTPPFLSPVSVATDGTEPPAGKPVSAPVTNTAAPTSAPTATTKAASSMNNAASSTNKPAPSTNTAASSKSKVASSMGARPTSGSGSPAAGSSSTGSGSPATSSSSTDSGSGSDSSPPATGSGASSPAKGANPPKGSPAKGSGTGSGSPATSSSSSGSGSGSNSSPTATGASSPANPAKGSPAAGSSGTGSDSPATGSSSTGSDSGSGAGHSSSSGSGSSSPVKGSGSSSSSPGSGSTPKTCNRKASKRAARELYDAHAARRRRFSTRSEDQL